MRVCPFPKSLHLRLLLCLALLAGSAGTQAAGQDDDWALFGRVLALVQTVTSAAASSDDPRAAERSIGGMLAGENRQANRLAAELMDEAFADMPAQYKGSMLALARDMATIARREAARRPAASDASAALQARRDLAAMGLQYHDAVQFLDAVKRNDALAVELFLAGRGVNTGARDADGRTAADIARAAGNAQISQLIGSVR